MPSITEEIKSMMGQETSTNVIPPTRFGAKDIEDLSWKNILEAYSCSECGRCTSECPANITGKKLSPRKIMMDVRDRAEEVGKSLDNKKSTNTIIVNKDNLPLSCPREDYLKLSHHDYNLYKHAHILALLLLLHQQSK